MPDETAMRSIAAWPRGFSGRGVLALVMLLVVTPAQGQNPSESKLSVQIYQQYTPGARQIVNAHPRVLKILKTDTAMLDAAREYKAGTPNGKVILRTLTEYLHFSINDSPEGAGSAWWTVCIEPVLPKRGTANYGLIDYVEGPNEGDNCPTFGDPGQAAWFSRFWQALAPKIRDAGYLPLLGSMAVGNPPGDVNNINAIISAFVPALRSAHAMGGAWSYHSYTYFYGYDPNGVELSYSLRYRQFYKLFAQSYPDLNDMPMILTEGGAEGGGGGWKVHGDQATFTNWLTWYDQQLKLDPYILGLTLFEIGNPGAWGSYDVEDIAPWIAAHLRNEIIVPSVPTNVSAGGGPEQVLLLWDGGYGSASYNIKRSNTSGGPYATVGSSTINRFTDTGIINGQTYYYVVSGLTIAGESVNSTQVVGVPRDGYAINCGGGGVGSFGGDAFYSTGSTWTTGETINTGGVANAAPAAVYASERSGNTNEPSFSYTFTNLNPGGIYTLRLHFAEIYFSSSGARRFNVGINGVQKLSNFDIYGETNARNKALVKSFSITADVFGKISIAFTPAGASFPKCSGIEMILLTPPPVPRIACSPVSLSRSVARGSTLPDDTLGVQNSSGGTLNYTIISNVGWLRVSPTCGVSTGALNTHTLTYLPADLTPGTYQATLTVTDPNASNSPRTATINLTVQAPVYPADMDSDGDIDQSDFGHFQNCLSGAGLAQTNPACAKARLDADNDVDQDDFAIFQRCLSGPNIPPNPNCAN